MQAKTNSLEKSALHKAWHWGIAVGFLMLVALILSALRRYVCCVINRPLLLASLACTKTSFFEDN